MLLQMALCIFNKCGQIQLAARGRGRGSRCHSFRGPAAAPAPPPGQGTAVWPVVGGTAERGPRRLGSWRRGRAEGGALEAAATARGPSRGSAAPSSPACSSSLGPQALSVPSLPSRPGNRKPYGSVTRCDVHRKLQKLSPPPGPEALPACHMFSSLFKILLRRKVTILRGTMRWPAFSASTVPCAPPPPPPPLCSSRTFRMLLKKPCARPQSLQLLLPPPSNLGSASRLHGVATPDTPCEGAHATQLFGQEGLPRRSRVSVAFLLVAELGGRGCVPFLSICPSTGI